MNEQQADWSNLVNSLIRAASPMTGGTRGELRLGGVKHTLKSSPLFEAISSTGTGR